MKGKKIIETTLLKMKMKQILSELEYFYDTVVIAEQKCEKHIELCESIGCHSKLDEDLKKFVEMKEDISNRMLNIRHTIFLTCIPKLILDD
jgi:NADH:ubiquinone oxidoreductase subunit E